MSDRNHLILAAIEWLKARSAHPLSWERLSQAEYKLAQATKIVMEEVK